MKAPRRRRSEGEGSVQEYQLKSGGQRFLILWYESVDPNDPDSPRRRRLQRGYHSWDQARAALRAKLAALDAGQLPSPLPSGVPTVAAFLHEWITAHRVAASTKAQYRRLIRLHINPYIGELPLTRVNPRTLSGMYRTLEDRGNKDGNKPDRHVGLGPNTVRKVHQILSSALESAVDDHLLVQNPAKMRGANPPSNKEVSAAKREIDVWRVHQMVDFLSWAEVEDPDNYALWWFIAHTGVRRGEAVGLRWKDVELPRTVQIRRSVQTIRAKGEAARKEVRVPKSSKSRTVAIDAGTAAVLRAHRATQGATHGFRVIQADAPVFTHPNGEALRPDDVSVSWLTSTGRHRATPRGSAAVRLTVHGLRHTHASHLLAAGVHPKVVQERLGHGSIGITMDLYSHLMDSVQTAAMNAYSDMLKRDSTPSKDDIDYELYDSDDDDDDEAGGSGNVRPL